MAKNVTNAQIADVIRDLGFNLPPDLDLTGAQNSEWVRKLVGVLQPMMPAGQYADDIFKKAKGIAQKVAEIPSDASTRDRLASTLSAYGVGGHELNQVLLKAQGYGHAAGRVFNDQDYFDAVSAVLGHDNPVVQRTFEKLQLPAARPIGTQPFGSAADQAQAAPAPAPPPPLPPGSGVHMGTTVSRATPGVAAPDTTPKTPGTTPGPPTTPPTTPAPKPELTNTAEGGAVVKALPKNATDAQVEQYLRQNYGSDVWVLAVPEIRKIVFDNLKNPSGVTQGIITSAIQATPWWQANGQHVADFLQGQSNNPRGLNDKILLKQKQVESKAAAFGMTLPPDRVLAIATDWEKWQWGDETLNAALAGEFHYSTNQHTVLTDQLSSDAKKYMVPMSENTMNQWGKAIIADPAQKGNWTEFLKGEAKKMFPAFASRLDGPENMFDIANPYVTTAATLLETDPQQIFDNLTDPKWMTALDQVDDKGNHSSMSYADWTRKIKDDPVYRFDYTEQAKQNATGMATDLLKRFGAIA